MSVRNSCSKIQARARLIGKGVAYRLESRVGGLIAGVLIYGQLDRPATDRRDKRTRVSDDGQFAIRLLDLQLGGRRRHPQGLIVGGVGDHDSHNNRRLRDGVLREGSDNQRIKMCKRVQYPRLSQKDTSTSDPIGAEDRVRR